MGYSNGSLQFLRGLVRQVPEGGHILELGAQDIGAGSSAEQILACLTQFHGSSEKAQQVLQERFSSPPPWRAWELFRGSRYTYQCVDLYAGEFIIQADLNVVKVRDADKGRFDLLTNLGTTEHVADQINVFRAAHDFTAVGGTMVHQVPFSGYYNHGLFNYQPIFFVFLAQANDYEIVSLGLSEPHLPYTIPSTDGIFNIERWRDIKIDSGMITCLLRKKNDAPFQLFTDFDQSEMGRLKVEGPGAEMLKNRYDLRVRS